MSKKVLLIEDDMALQELIIAYLEPFGFTACGYSNPKQALDALLVRKEPFDIVVLDLMLPEMAVCSAKSSAAERMIFETFAPGSIFAIIIEIGRASCRERV